ncbi:MAG: hypothetical protein K1X50_18830 [Candidatus Promineofilum sp.]|nr:hypothetical protein [Promineifilum sp.]
MTNDMVVVEQGSPYAVMPVLDIQAAAARRQAVIDFTRRMMVKGTDFGVVPGTGDKPTLLKPGAEKLASLFGLSPLFEIVEREMDWTGDAHGGEPFFYLQYRCTLTRGELVAGQGVGSCNSWEKKYRYRTVYPNRATAEERERGRLETRNGRNGSYQVIVVNNPDPADVVNTIDKMAQKRALVAAVLIAVNASELFTQDVEDYRDIVDGEWTEPAHSPTTAVLPTAPASAKPTAKAARTTAPPPSPDELPAREARLPTADTNDQAAQSDPPDFRGELPDYRRLAIDATAANEFDYAAYMTLRNGVYDSVDRIAKTRASLVPDWLPAPKVNEALLLALEVYRDKRAAVEAEGEAAADAHKAAKSVALSAYSAMRGG